MSIESASENFMDEVEAEETAATAPEKPKKPEPPPSATEKRVSITSHQKNSEEAPEESKVEALQGNATENCVVEAAAPCDPSKDGSEAMEGIVSMSAKRGHGDTVNDSDLPKDASGGPPPPKSALTRRMSFKPKPNIPPDGRPEAKPPNKRRSLASLLQASDMPPLKQRRLDAAAESSHQTSVEEAGHESPKHGEPSSTSVRSEADPTKRLLALKELQVKGRRCVVVDPQEQQVRLRLHWLLHGVCDEEVRASLAAFGKVVEVSRAPKAVEATQLIAVPGSAPPAAEPERAVKEAGPVEAGDAGEAHGETAGSGDDMCVTSATLKRPRGGTGQQDKEPTSNNEEPPAKTLQGRRQEKDDGAAVLAASIKAPDAREEDAKRENIVQATTEACAGGPAKEGLDMECEESAIPAVGKRQLEVSEENGKPEASAGEPLPKAQFTRRPTLKIQPKVPPDRRATPPAAKTMPADPPYRLRGLLRLPDWPGGRRAEFKDVRCKRRRLCLARDG
ncbi:hypothetical protein HPB50_014387 [Hyalomma asiaticum]|uniref:Uncharacterized protein n=1 Tax=Hyalomma asiaticum TaxID=266040 RepID=A0ACB7SH14_HYAAI|nr:hypothetical protein HPB50_014387 [Hyalomma asiaticum]